VSYYSFVRFSGSISLFAFGLCAGFGCGSTTGEGLMPGADASPAHEQPGPDATSVSTPTADGGARDGAASPEPSPMEAGAGSLDAGAPDAGPDVAEMPVRFVAIGDFGFHTLTHEADVAALVHALLPDFVITTGDNNYPRGEAATLDLNVGLHYSEFIAPYLGEFGEGAAQNRFFPSPGNHDWGLGNLDAYLAYFSLPGNERYYDFTWGPVHLFALDSDVAEPDGVTVDSVQAAWLRDGLAASSAPFKVVYLHHPPYSSGQHGSQPLLAWPFAAWGASLVLAGHEHDYERLTLAPGVPLVVNGIGGVALRPVRETVHERSQLAYDGAHGAMLFEADSERMVVRALGSDGSVLDAFMLKADVPSSALESLPTVIPWSASYRVRSSAPGDDWTLPDHDDASWLTVQAPVGFGRGDEASTLAPEGSTVWLRHDFFLEDTPGDAFLRLVCDDGAVVYLNGQEVHRVNLPSGPIGAHTLALSPVKGEWEARAVDTLLDERALAPGRNVLAVEVHQASLGSSDLRFDLELRAR
jgi:tartrate-resistant acid phosphatase type 5